MKYLPAASDVISLPHLPDFFSGIRGGVNQLLAGLVLKEYQVEQHPHFGGASWFVVLRTTQRVDLEIPGTGLAIIFNPSFNPMAPGSFTDIPLSLSFHLPILDYVRGFRIAEFAGSPESLFKLITQIVGAEEETLTGAAIRNVLPSSAAADLIALINSHYALSPPLAATLTGDIALDALAIVEAVGTHPTFAATEKDMLDVLLETYVLSSNPPIPPSDFVEKIFAFHFPKGVVASVTQLFIPKIDASIQLSAGLEFPRNYLVPIKTNGDVETNTNIKTVLFFSAGEFRYSTEGLIGFSDALTISFPPQYPKAQIGNSGLTVGFTNAKLDLSRDKNIPEAVSDGRPDDFIGVYIEEASIGLPAFWKKDSSSTAEITGKKLLIGTGGISGTIGLDVKNGSLFKANLNAFSISLDAFDLAFRQNVITGSNIHGTLVIPGFKDNSGGDAKIHIDVHIDHDGDFAVTASDAAGVRISIPGVLDFDITSASVERKGSRFFCAVTGTLQLRDQGGVIGNFLPEKLDIKRLIIWDDGKIEIEGGKITLPRVVSLHVGPVNLSVTAIGFGSHEQEFQGQLRQYKYFTFDGGVSVNPGGVDVSGSGIAFYYTVDNDGSHPAHRFLRIQSIAVDLAIPGSASPDSALILLKGYLSMRAAEPPSTGSEYAGSIAFTLPKLKMGGSAAMRLNPSVPAFLVDVGLEISTPILLGSTGLGIYGFRGLFGLRYIASKGAIPIGDDDPWWKYYKAKLPPDNREGIQASKFSQIRGWSLGAGVSLATTDGGYAFSSKIFFLLSLPDVFLLQGQGQILKGRILLTDTTDPPFFALIAVTKNSIETAFGLKYAVPDDDSDGKKAGGIVTVDALIQMGYFWENSSAWYIDIGRENPPNERVLVRLLSIIDAYFYFMMSGAGIRAGAGASYGLSKQFGPLKAELRAYLDTAGHISFRPRQIGASIRIGGNVDLSIFGFGFGLSAAASLAAEGTKPFTVTGSLEVCVRVLRKDRCARFEFTWIFNQNLDLSETKLLKEHLPDCGKALNINTQETYELWTGSALPAPAALDAFVVPMDSYIDLELNKGVKPSPSVAAAFGGNTTGSNYVEYVAPQRGKTDRVRHEYTLDSIEVLYHDGAGWKPYDIYGATVPPQLAGFITSNPATLKQGFWQYEEPNQHNKLRVLAQTPLTYASQGSGDLVPEDSGIITESIFCAPKPIAETCTGFGDFAPSALPAKRRFFHHQFQLRVTGADGSVTALPSDSQTRAVRVGAGGAIELFLVEPAARVRLTLNAGTDSARARFYTREPRPPSRPGLSDGYDYLLVSTKEVPRGNGVEVLYDDRSRPVEKIVIDAGECSVDPPLVCDATLTPQAHDLERFLTLLVARGQHLSADAELLTHDLAQWNGVFFNTSLYGAPADPVFVRYSFLSATSTVLHGQLTDWKQFACAIDLSLIEGATSIDWKALTAVRNLRADVDRVEGQNFTFLLDGDVATPNGPVRVTLRGRSCYPILNCQRKAPVGGALTAQATALQTLLSLLAADNRLVQPRVKLSAEETAAYDAALAQKPPGGPRKVWMTASTAPQPLSSLVLQFSEGKTMNSITLRLPHPRASFQFDDVTGFAGIRADRNLLAKGDARSFLVDVRVRTPGGESTVVLSGNAPFAITAVLGPPNTLLGPPDAMNVSAKAIFTVGQPADDCAIYLSRVCLLDYPSAAFNDTLPSQSSVDAEVKSIVNAFQGSIQPLWRPDTRYAIRLTTTDTLFREGGSNPQTHYPTTAVFGFRTAGPLGHFHIYRGPGGTPVQHPAYAKLAATGHGDEFKLIGLLHYLDFPKCYPNADGQLLNAKPLFCDNPTLFLFYLQTYVARMFCDWAPWGGLPAASAAFEVLVKDPAPDPAVAEAGAVAAVWKLSPIPLVSRDVTVLNNMIKHGSPCGSVTEIKPTWLNTEFPLQRRLEPRKLYTAIFNLRFDGVTRELLRYGFQSSLYGNLAEQVGTPTVFQIARAFPAADLAAAAHVLKDDLAPGDPLRQTFADPFDRLLDGALKLGAVHPPAATELNVVRDIASNRILGILLRNPEPFNDPKLPAATAATTVRLSVNSGSEQLHKAVLSRDLSQAFLTNADNSMNLPAGASCRITFDYQEWNGAAYATAQSAHVDLVLP